MAWMRAALREDADSGRGRTAPGRPIDHHRLNVGLVCAGIAIELIYKVLLIADRAQTVSQHSITELHRRLEQRKHRVESILVDEGWGDVDAFLQFMDNHLRHADRKYWMSNPSKQTRNAAGFSLARGPMTIPGLARVHHKMATLVNVRELVDEYNLEHAKVLTAQILATDNPTDVYERKATRRLEVDGRDAEYSVYESNMHVPDDLKGWWELPSESGEPTGVFVYLLNAGEYDHDVQYWPR